jgi:hypothetical protein
LAYFISYIELKSQFLKIKPYYVNELGNIKVVTFKNIKTGLNSYLI